MVPEENIVFIPGVIGRTDWTGKGRAREGKKEKRLRGLKRYLDGGGMHSRLVT